MRSKKCWLIRMPNVIFRGASEVCRLLWKWSKSEKQKVSKTFTGAEASPIADDKTKYERGKKILEELSGTPQPDKLSGYSAFAPSIDTFLKGHLFAEIFEREL